MEAGSCQWCAVTGQEARQGCRFPPNIGKHFFYCEGSQTLTELPKEFAASLSLVILKTQLDIVLSNLSTSAWLWLTLL